jgi:hypothetical protein
VNTLTIGAQNSGNSSYGIGGVNVNGSGTLMINNAASLGFTGSNPNANTRGILNIVGGGTVCANLITNGGSATSAITMNGGTLIVTNRIGSPGAAIPAIAITNAMLGLKVNGANNTTNVVAANLIASGLNVLRIDAVENVEGNATIPLISYATLSGSVSTNFALQLPAGFAGNLVDNAAEKRIDLDIAPAPPVPAPFISEVRLSGGDLIISGTNGVPGQSYHVLTSTNLALPLAQWTLLSSNVIADSNGLFGFTNGIPPEASMRFYLLQVP